MKDRVVLHVSWFNICSSIWDRFCQQRNSQWLPQGLLDVYKQEMLLSVLQTRFAVSARTDCQHILSVSNIWGHKSWGKLYILLNAAGGVVPPEATGPFISFCSRKPQGKWVGKSLSHLREVLGGSVWKGQRGPSHPHCSEGLTSLCPLRTKKKGPKKVQKEEQSQSPAAGKIPKDQIQYLHSILCILLMTEHLTDGIFSFLCVLFYRIREQCTSRKYTFSWNQSECCEDGWSPNQQQRAVWRLLGNLQ